jgi:hypothetical protein
MGMIADTLGISDQFVFLEAALLLAVVRAEAFKQGVELRGMVEVLEVTKFVKHHIVLKVLRDAHQIQVKVYVPL